MPIPNGTQKKGKLSRWNAWSLDWRNRRNGVSELSQVSTSFHSTRQGYWVLSQWMASWNRYESESESEPKIRKQKCLRRNTFCLEVELTGRILRRSSMHRIRKETGVEVKKYRLQAAILIYTDATRDRRVLTLDNIPVRSEKRYTALPAPWSWTDFSRIESEIC
jgi:hypothetical protein